MYALYSDFKENENTDTPTPPGGNSRFARFNFQTNMVSVFFFNFNLISGRLVETLAGNLPRFYMVG